MPTLRLNFLLLLVIAFLFVLTACNQNSRPMPEAAQPATPESPVAKLAATDSDTAASIRGTILFTGVVPSLVEIDMGMDPGCTIASKQPNLSQQYAVNNGALANVYVYVKEGLAGKAFAVPATPVILDQRGCRYEPHVLALMAGQTLRVLNSDPAMHNVHAQPKAPGNQEWNMSQMPKGAPIEKTFRNPEVMMLFKCNQHPWMKAYVNVAANPFYAVSDANGNFEIKGLPPGEYTVAAVHESLGEQVQRVTVNAKERTTLNYTFAGP